jgi:hypothetical protein
MCRFFCNYAFYGSVRRTRIRVSPDESFMSTVMSPISWLPFYEDGMPPREIPVEIALLEPADIAFWHTNVQPLIDTWYGERLPSVDEEPAQPEEKRADVGWNWWTIAGLAIFHNVATSLPQNRSGQAFGWCLRLVVAEHRVPIGMMSAVPSFHCIANGAARDRGFVWYLSAAPDELYRKFNIPTVGGVGTALLDTAIQSRLRVASDAETLLHADPAGGEELHGFYIKCGMTCVEEMTTRVSLLRPAKASQYFLMDDGAARAFCAKYDLRRT